MKPIYPIFTSMLLGGFSPWASAEEIESCGDILRYASRDTIKAISYTDQRKFYYQRVCRSDDTGIEIDFGDATSALGLNYTSKEEYCKAEKSLDAATSYTQVDSSQVVRSSLDAYVACRALSSKGIGTSISYPSGGTPIVFSVGVKHLSSTPQSVDSLAIDPDAVSCSTQVDGQVKTFDSKFNVIGYQLPQSEAQWSLLCTRKPETTKDGNKTYPPVQLILTTSVGSLPLSLPEAGYASGEWASTLASEEAVLSKRVAAVETGLATQKLVVPCNRDGWNPNRDPVPACPSGYKDSGLFSHSAPGGHWGFGGSCRVCLGN